MDVDPFRFQAHPDVWLLVAFLTGSYVYMVRVVGPHAVAVGQQVVTRANVAAFAGAMALLWAASDWPIHDLGENYLYSVHMLQHMMLSYFLPPLALLATPGVAAARARRERARLRRAAAGSAIRSSPACCSTSR